MELGAVSALQKPVENRTLKAFTSVSGTVGQWGNTL